MIQPDNTTPTRGLTKLRYTQAFNAGYSSYVRNEHRDSWQVDDSLAQYGPKSGAVEDAFVDGYYYGDYGADGWLAERAAQIAEVSRAGN